MKKLLEKAALWIAFLLSLLYGAALFLLPYCQDRVTPSSMNNFDDIVLRHYMLRECLTEHIEAPFFDVLNAFLLIVFSFLRLFKHNHRMRWVHCIISALAFFLPSFFIFVSEAHPFFQAKLIYTPTYIVYDRGVVAECVCALPILIITFLLLPKKAKRPPAPPPTHVRRRLDIKKLPEKAALRIAFILSLLYGAALCLLPYCQEKVTPDSMNNYGYIVLKHYMLQDCLQENIAPPLYDVLNAFLLIVFGFLSLFKHNHKMRWVHCIISVAAFSFCLFKIAPFLFPDAFILLWFWAYTEYDSGTVVQCICAFLILIVHLFLMPDHAKKQPDAPPAGTGE